MKALFTCEMNYIDSRHLSQLYAGFEILQAHGIVDVKINGVSRNIDKPILQVTVNGRYNILYDMLDGFNWIEGGNLNNLEYFRNHIKADYYFKRSFTHEIIEYAPDNSKVYPLGLNYAISFRSFHRRGLKSKVETKIRNNRFLSRLLKIIDSDCYNEDFEFYPMIAKQDKVLFMTRLWDPALVKEDHLKSQRNELNNFRIECIKLCRKELGERFVGGILHDNYSQKICPDQVAPYSLTKKEYYLAMVKESNICIATTGLHNSIGFKMAEYVAASRSIISEPLYYDLPGNFEVGRNYLRFNDADGLLQNIHELCNNKEAQGLMMRANSTYYSQYLRPDMLVLNTLLKLE